LDGKPQADVARFNTDIDGADGDGVCFIATKERLENPWFSIR